MGESQKNPSQLVLELALKAYVLLDLNIHILSGVD